MTVINAKNENKINAIIAEAEGKARERRIDYKDIVKAISIIEKKLGIAKKDMEGITADIDIHAQDFPRAYKWRAESTYVVIVRKNAGWYIKSVGRGYTRKASQKYLLTLTETAKDAIIRNMTQFN